MLKKYIQRYAEWVNNVNKLWITGVYIIFAIVITVCFIYIPKLSDTHTGILTFFNIVMVGLPILVVISNIVSFKTTMSSLQKLASLYLQIILMFGVIYYFGTAASTAKKIKSGNVSDSSSHAAITGIDTDWVTMTLKQQGDKSEIFKEALIGFQDCIHFSLITSATVGYGDSYPVNPMAKLLVDIQVLIS